MKEESKPGVNVSGKIVAASCLIAVIAIGVALDFGPRAYMRGHISSELGNAPIANADYGYRLMAQTPELIGPDVANPHMRYTGNRLSCASCHLRAGDAPGSLNLYSAARNYPKFSTRAGVIISFKARINECMVRSMNGRPLPENGAELIAMVAWLRSLAERNPMKIQNKSKAMAPTKFEPPDRASSLYAGKQLFEKRCATCHGYHGLGLVASDGPMHGYIFPPVWGPNSFNAGAGMHRVLTAATFIKARMPLGRPDLTDDEAYDLAAYINAQPRPEMANFAADYPDKRTKPIDAAYPPFIDPFPLEQHRFGPFQPIETYYQKLKASSK